MRLSEELTFIVPVSLITIITIPRSIFIIIKLNSINNQNHPSNMGVEEWLEDFDSFHNFTEKNYPYI